MNLSIRKDIVFLINVMMTLFLLTMFLNIPLSTFVSVVMGGAFIGYTVALCFVTINHFIMFLAMKGLAKGFEIGDMTDEIKEAAVKGFEVYLHRENNRTIFDKLNTAALCLLAAVSCAVNIWMAPILVLAGLILRTITYNSCLTAWEKNKK